MTTNRYSDVITTNSMDPKIAERYIQEVRSFQRHLMEVRAKEIEEGLRHETPSMAKDREVLGENFKD